MHLLKKHFFHNALVNNTLSSIFGKIHFLRVPPGITGDRCFMSRYCSLKDIAYFVEGHLWYVMKYWEEDGDSMLDDDGKKSVWVMRSRYRPYSPHDQASSINISSIVMILFHYSFSVFRKSFDHIFPIQLQAPWSSISKEGSLILDTSMIKKEAHAQARDQCKWHLKVQMCQKHETCFFCIGMHLS